VNAPAGTIDVHAHFIPDFYRTALAAAGQDRPDGIPALPAWDEHTTLHTMNQTACTSATSNSNRSTRRWPSTTR
jgi:hypothetical protein